MKHCPTESMLVDHFTKLLQGSLFRKFWAEIINIPEVLDNLDMVWEGSTHKRGGMINLHHIYNNPIPQECVMEY